MKKIPTLFEKIYENNKFVGITNKVKLSVQILGMIGHKEKNMIDKILFVINVIWAIYFFSTIFRKNFVP